MKYIDDKNNVAMFQRHIYDYETDEVIGVVYEQEGQQFYLTIDNFNEIFKSAGEPSTYKPDNN